MLHKTPLYRKQIALVTAPLQWMYGGKDLSVRTPKSIIFAIFTELLGDSLPKDRWRIGAQSTAM